MNSYLQLNPNLFLVKQSFQKDSAKEKQVEVNTNHIFIIDCSGSMWDELSKIRRDLYNKISTIMKPNDSVSIIWFSGRGQYGVILEDFSLKSDTSLNKVRDLIEKWLTPKGLTAFKEPFEEAKKVVARVFKSKPDCVHSLFFLTDGCDNQYSTKEILKAVSEVREDVASSTIVEYGWYCNRELLAKIAAEIGGVHIFSEHFQDYEPYLEKEFHSSNSSKRKYVTLEGKPDFGFAYNMTEDGDIINYSVNEKNEVLISENDKEIYFLSKSPVGKQISFTGTPDILNESYKVKNSRIPDTDILKPLYAAMFSFSRISDYNTVSEILRHLGDARLIKKKANTFGTQKISELESEFLTAAKDPGFRFIDGYNPNLEPKEDAYCVLDLIEDLMQSDDNKWYPMHEAFNYKRIGRKAIAKSVITEQDKEELEKLVKAGKVNELKDKIEEVSKKEEGLEFHYDDKEGGHPITDLVWNEKRANLSVQVRYTGYVELPDNKFDKVPKKFDTQIFRNYTLIKDGVIHSYQLPVSLDEATFNKVQSEGLLAGEKYEANKIYVLNFSELPVINRKMVETMSAKKLFEDEYELLTLKAKNTVFNHYKKMKIGSKSLDFIEMYGSEAADWLKSLGLASYGFNPPSTLEKSEEEIFVNSLQVKINKLTLMTTKADFDKVLAKVKAKEQLSEREALLLPGIQEFEKFMESMDGINDEKLIESWINKKSASFRKRKNELMNSISKAKFLCVIGKSWFKEFSSRDEKEMELLIEGKKVLFTIDDKMEKIKI